jgi:hypothetical protein
VEKIGAQSGQRCGLERWQKNHQPRTIGPFEQQPAIGAGGAEGGKEISLGRRWRQWKEVRRGFGRGWVWSFGDDRRLERAWVKPQDAANRRSRTALEQSDGRLAQVIGNGALLGAVFSPGLELSLEFE